MSEKILVVDDEKPIADILKFNLEKEGFQVSLAYTGKEAVAKALEESPDLIVLDIMLPEMSGYQVCQAVRRHSHVPILMLTARDEEGEKVKGLELGADDYVTKPFGMRELIARVKALLRRTEAAALEPVDSQIEYGDLVVKLSTHEVWKKEQPIQLTLREFELLRYLLLRQAQLFSRETLLEEVWGYEYYGDIRTVDVTVRRLREKIEDDPSNPAYLVTKRGVGYMLRSL